MGVGKQGLLSLPHTERKPDKLPNRTTGEELVVKRTRRLRDYRNRLLRRWPSFAREGSLLQNVGAAGDVGRLIKILRTVAKGPSLLS